MREDHVSNLRIDRRAWRGDQQSIGSGNGRELILILQFQKEFTGGAASGGVKNVCDRDSIVSSQLEHQLTANRVLVSANWEHLLNYSVLYIMI